MKDRYCPWCDKKYEAPSDSGPLCDECRSELLEQPREFLVDMLGHVAGVNALAMAALRASPHLLEEFGLTGGGEGARPKLTLKELAKTRKRVNLNPA